MQATYEVVTDLEEIARLNSELGRRLTKFFPCVESREITYPAGHHAGTVHFQRRSGTEVPGWSHRNEQSKRLNFIVFGEPGSTRWVEISVQLNFPAGKYSRAFAGAFVKDSHGDVLVAHRGKLTKGKAGLKKEEVCREFAPRLVEASDGGRITKLILITCLDDAALGQRLCDFAKEAREVATRLGARRDDANAALYVNGSPRSLTEPRSTGRSTQRLLRLRKYFDEHSGFGEMKGHGGGKRTVTHGDIVKALEEHSCHRGDAQKAQAIDLAVVAADAVDLFEVKTSARTTDVYTGVGQLLIHGESVAELLRLPVRRYLVLPQRPNKQHERHIVKKGDMRVVTYRKLANGYEFDGMR